MKPIGETLADLHQRPAPWYLGPYFILTLALMLSAIVYPAAAEVVGSGLLPIVNTTLLMASVYAVVNHKWLFRLLLILVVPILVSIWFVDPYDDSELLDLVTTLSTNAFLFSVLVAVFADVIRSKRVTADTIFGAIAVYLLFGVIVAMMFQFLNNISPGSVVASVGEAKTIVERYDQFGEILYFSFVTLTSVGYGDLTPIGPAARSLAMFEGVVGQLYLAVLIARLVGTLVEVDGTRGIIDVNGVGYEVFAPTRSLTAWSGEDVVTVHVSTQVREDAFQLFAFDSALDRQAFLAVLRVEK